MVALNQYVDQQHHTVYVATDKFYKHLLENILFQLGNMVFGTDMVGENAYYYLRNLIQHYEINPNQGIWEWMDQVQILNI